MNESALSRLEWLNALQRIYVSLSELTGGVLRKQLLKEVSLSSQKTRVVGHRGKTYSLTQVLRTIARDERELLNWDQVLDLVVRVGDEEENTEEFPAANRDNSLIVVSTWGPPAGRFLRGESLLYLNLSESRLKDCNFQLPKNLIILNLALNYLTEVKFDMKLPGLKLLNASNNSLQTLNIEFCKNLKELYMNSNHVQNISSLCELTALTVLDVSNNRVEDLSPLALLPLKALALQNNLNLTIPNSLSSLPINPPSIHSFSSFSDYNEIAFTSALLLSTQEQPYQQSPTPYQGPKSPLGKRRFVKKENRSSVITSKSILDSSKKSYGNPTRAVMISPSPFQQRNLSTPCPRRPIPLKSVPPTN